MTDDKSLPRTIRLVDVHRVLDRRYMKANLVSKAAEKEGRMSDMYKANTVLREIMEIRDELVLEAVSSDGTQK